MAPSRRQTDSARRRVALVLNSVVYGGVEEHVLLLSGRLARYGYDPLVVASSKPELSLVVEKLNEKGTNYVLLDVAEKTMGPQLLATFKLVRILRESKCDLMHVHLISYSGGRVPLLAAQMTGIPTIVTHHIAPTDKIGWRNAVLRAPFLAMVKKFIAVSQANREAQIAHMGLPDDRVLAVHNGIVPPGPPKAGVEEWKNYRRASRLRICREGGIPEGAPIVGCVGRLAEQKGYKWLVQAAPEILRRVPDAHFVIIGDGPLFESLQHQVNDLGVYERFHWFGFRKEGQELLAGFDVLAMPSEREGLPLVLLEAMATGIPVVAHAVDGIPEALSDGAEGWLVAPHDVATLADRLVRVLSSPEEARKMGERAQARVQAEFTVDVMTRRIVQVYDQVLR
jgi:glycosyltransferase involved in cell wall biosynthesis